ncbi:MAG: hypothetical protein MJ185_07695 [Treponema sp.]|nr:hypothetical protein [Treponema sp.]
MKKLSLKICSSTFLISSLFIISGLSSCKGKTEESANQTTVPVTEVTDFEIPDSLDLFEEQLLPSVVLSPNAGLNVLGRDNQMHKMKSLSRGNAFETVQVNGAVRTLNLYDEKENAETYIHAVSDNVDFWIYKNYVAENALPAIIVEETKGLKFGQIVALGLEKVEADKTVEDENSKAVVYYFDKKQDKVCSMMMDQDKVSTYKDDVEMAAIIEKLRVTARATPRNELFLRAEKLNPSPAMKKVLEGEKTEKLSYDYQEVLKSMPGSRYIVNVGELNTVDQSKDPFKN